MKKQALATLTAFAIELVVYAALMIGYFFLVLHFLGDGLRGLEIRHRFVYAGVAILLILAQAVLLEIVTTFLLRFIRRRSE
ncbi:MAG TPA: hypothetical protein VEI58_08290 [Chthoniobacterales bacterium]|nr:hypothetical protein [Chthoniobacterales bacterium]